MQLLDSYRVMKNRAKQGEHVFCAHALSHALQYCLTSPPPGRAMSAMNVTGRDGNTEVTEPRRFR